MNATGNCSYWNFISEYLPGYYTDNRVLWSNILIRYLDDEEADEKDLAIIEGEFSSRKSVLQELKRIDMELMKEAMEEYFSQMAEKLKKRPSLL